MIGRSYWATGITLRFGAGAANGLDGWAAELKFYDDGFGGSDAGPVSTEGEVRTRYFVSEGDEQAGAVAAAQAIKRDAAGMGIQFVKNPIAGSPLLYLHRDNWATPDTERGSHETETTLNAVALAIGWPGARNWLLVPPGGTVKPSPIGDPDVAPAPRNKHARRRRGPSGSPGRRSAAHRHNHSARTAAGHRSTVRSDGRLRSRLRHRRQRPGPHRTGQHTQPHDQTATERPVKSPHEKGNTQ